MNVDAKQRYLMVAEAAYFRAQQRNFAPGHEHEDWLAAERQVDEMLKHLAAVPMQAELQSQAETKPTARQARKQPAKAVSTAPKAAATAEAKPTRKRQAKSAAPATETQPTRTRRAKVAVAPAAGAAGTASVSGGGTETEVKPKRGRHPKAAVPESSAPAKRPGRPRKPTFH